MKKLHYKDFSSSISKIEYAIIFLFSIFPVFINFPYRINIFLSWEGAYRLYLGQIPYRDFGLPMGFGYWIIPAAFFKLFGPYLISLVKAQAFINIISALAFRSILKSIGIQPSIRFISILLFLISFSFVNFWPWYNHSVIVFELIGISFLLKYIFNHRKPRKLLQLFLSSFFIFLAFFTKQDAGAFALLIGLALVVCKALYERKVYPIIWFIVFYLVIALCFILPFIPYHIGYWFNYGQFPHYDRLSLYDIFDVFFGKSEWIKFYLLIIFLILIYRFQSDQFLKDQKFIYNSILTLGILVEAAVFQVTSYIPEYNNIFFHSFAVSYILSYSGLYTRINLQKWRTLIFTSCLIILWWSSRPWQYTTRILTRYFPAITQIDTNEVSIRTFSRSEPNAEWDKPQDPNLSRWKYSQWKVFKNISMPEKTIEGIQRITNLPLVKKDGPHLKVLNMTELTPLAKIIGYVPETGSEIPLWYHKNVAIYEREIKEYENKIQKNYYDIVLFEYIPILNNFYPFEIRNALKKDYEQVDEFPGPRRNGYSVIEVYLKKTQ